MTQRHSAEEFREFLWDNKAKITSAIRRESGLDLESVCHMITATRNASIKIQQCSSESILLSACQGLQLGLEPNNTLGHFYLVPYKGVCTGQIGYKGLIQLAYRSGQIRSIETHNAFENEEFKVDWGMEPPIFHSPKPPRDRGEFIASYTKICTTTGGTIWELMWDEEIEVIRKGAAYKDGPWKTDTGEMRRKTVTKRGLKYAPASARLQAALAADDMAEIGEPLSPPPSSGSGTSGTNEPPSDLDALAAKSKEKRGGATQKATTAMQPTEKKLPEKPQDDRSADPLILDKATAKNTYLKLPEDVRATILLDRGLDDNFKLIDNLRDRDAIVDLSNALKRALEVQKETQQDAAANNETERPGDQD